MSNKVIAFKFPFESAGPHSTESNDLSKYFSAVPDSCIQFDKKMVTHTFVALPNAKNIAHICTNTKHKGPERTSKSNKINLIDKVSYPSEWDVNLQIELSHHQISPSCGSSHLGLGLCLHHQTRRNFSFHVKTRIDSKIKNKLTCPSDSCDKCALHIAVNMQQTQVWNFRLWRLGQSRWHLLLSRSS